MINLVKIKSFTNGIAVILDDTVDFDLLLNEIAMKFKESEKFFHNSRLAISFEGRTLSVEEENEVLETISTNASFEVVCVIGKDEVTNQSFLKALNQVDHKIDEDVGRFYKGTLKNGQILETETTIIVLGDIYPGSAIISSKDIIILGGLFGEAYAGANGEEGHFVVALEMAPERLRIGSLKYKTKEKINKWSIKPKILPKIAYKQGNNIIIESITKELLSEITYL